jgi:hypothetical protein
MTEVRKTWMMRERLRITTTSRSPEDNMGRVGGGWQWCVGFEAGRGFRTVILNCLTFMVRINRGRRREPAMKGPCGSYATESMALRCERGMGHTGNHRHGAIEWRQGRGYMMQVEQMVRR